MVLDGTRRALGKRRGARPLEAGRAPIKLRGAADRAGGFPDERRGTGERQRQLIGRKPGAISVRSLPCAVIFCGALAWPQTQDSGTAGASATMAGRSVSVRPRIAESAELANTMCSAPASTVIEPTKVPTMRSAGGRPAAAL